MNHLTDLEPQSTEASAHNGSRQVKVTAKLPLALLEALHALDSPLNLLEDEDTSTSMPRRLGLSAVVRAQIRRYRNAGRGQRVPAEEAQDLIRLILRRPDAEAIIRRAGVEFVRRQLQGKPNPATRLLPAGLSRVVLRLTIRRTLHNTLGNGQLAMVGTPTTVQIGHPLTAGLDEAGLACGLYSAALEEIVFRCTGIRAPVEHTRCLSRGHEMCEWSTGY